MGVRQTEKVNYTTGNEKVKRIATNQGFFN